MSVSRGDVSVGGGVSGGGSGIQEVVGRGSRGGGVFGWGF